jgi:hypothetical protein
MWEANDRKNDIGWGGQFAKSKYTKLHHQRYLNQAFKLKEPLSINDK